MDYLDDFVCEYQSDEFEEDSFWFWIDECDLGMGIEN